MVRLPERRTRRDATVSTRPLAHERSEALDALETERFDLLVIGGGITGSYVALDAVLRGLRVALVEKDDFAAGTSSKSSKMVHGGLRYIEQGDLGLVRRSLKERQRLRRNAPHLVQRLPFLFPVLAHGGAIDRRLVRGFEGLLWAYDAAGGWREGVLHQALSREEVLARCPTLRADVLERGLLYYDARADDARLTLTVARTAAFHGAVVLNHARAVEMRRDRQQVRGATVEADGRRIEVRAGAVVNATGVWLRDWSGASVEAPAVRPAKGVHVAVPWMKIRNDCTVTIPVPGRTRRATITRWGDTSLLGTTDDDYDGDLDDVHCTREELDFLLEGARTALDVDLGPDDVVGSIAGCRPLVAAPGGTTMEARRGHEIRTDPDGLVTVVGGKLTTARHMAEHTVDAALAVLDRSLRCRTADARLLGGTGYDPEASTATGGLAAHLSGRYGMESMHVSAILAEDPALAAPLVPGLPYLEGEVVYSARHEMARTVEDVLARRTRLRIMARDASAEAAARVGALLGRELGLGGDEVAAQVDAYRTSVTHERKILMGDAA